jgi:hypothetical protein
LAIWYEAETDHIQQQAVSVVRRIRSSDDDARYRVGLVHIDRVAAQRGEISAGKPIPFFGGILSPPLAENNGIASTEGGSRGDW